MASNDTLRRYLDAGLAFTALTRARAEAIVEDLVKQGEVQTEQAQNAVRDLMDRSRQNTESFFEQVRSEVRDQVSNLGLATQADIARIERKVGDLGSSTSSRPAAKRATAKRATAKKASARKAAAKRTTAKKTTTKKAAARKAPARKTAGPSSTAKKATRRAGSTKKTAAKKA